MAEQRRLYRDGALADGRSDQLLVGVSILVDGGRVTWIRPADDEGPLGDAASVEIVDASGSTIIPGMVDAHSHVTLPGGAHWIDRLGDPDEAQRRYGEANGRLLTQAGVRWARDVGSAPSTGSSGEAGPALALEIRDRWRSRPAAPYVRAAGTWIMYTDTMPGRCKR